MGSAILTTSPDLGQLTAPILTPLTAPTHWLLEPFQAAFVQRSLTVAGARSTLLSLWKVDDAATAEFMDRFYQRLKAGEGRSDALAAVQEEFRSGKMQSGTGHEWKEPYYWAAWQLVGDWRPIADL